MSLNPFSPAKESVDIKKIYIHTYSMNISYIMNLVSSQLARRITLVFTGNILAAGLGFLAVLIVARNLTVSDFGLFIIVISFMRTTSSLSDLGMDTAMIRFTSSYLVVEKTEEATQVLRMSLIVKGISSFILAVIIFNTAGLLSTELFHYQRLTSPLKLAAFGMLAASASNYFISVFCTYQLFRMSVILQLLVDFGKFFAVMVLMFSVGIDLFSAVAVFAFAPLLGVLFGFGQLYLKLFSKIKPIKNLFKLLLSYSKWTFTCNVCNLVFSFVGIFMLAKMLGSEAAGIYGLALNLAFILPILAGSLRAVLLPEVSRFREIKQLEKYIRSSLKISVCIGISIVPFLFFSHKVILFFFGSRYLDAVPIFNWLMLSYIILTINSTIRVTLHSMNRPQVLAVVDLLKLTVMVIGCYLLIPFLGTLAPAIMALIVNVIVLSFFSIYVFKKIREGDIAFQNEEIIEPHID